MKRETVITLAPSTLRKVANYVLQYVRIEKSFGYGKTATEARFYARLEAAAKTILTDTSKRRLALKSGKEKP